ncbi:hypothetical protein D3C72_1883500 [compost metagenome]
MVCTCGAVAIEYARRVPSRKMNSMYWPAKYWNTMLAGICSCTRITSCESFSSAPTRTGIFLMGKALASVTWRDSSTTSVCAVARQVSTKPASSSAGVIAWVE